MENKKLAKNAILNTIKTISSIAFPIITFPYVSRKLGVESLGVYNFSTSIISYFLLIAGLGISTYAIREGTQYRDNYEKIQKFVSEIFSINIVSTLLAYLGLVLCIVLIPKFQNYKVGILILSLEIVSTTFGTVWLCNIFEDFKSITIRTIVFQVISLCLMLLFVKKPDDLFKYIAIVALSNSGSNFVNFAYVRKKYCKFGITFNIDWKKHMKPILIIFSTTIAVTIYVSSDITMLGFMTSDYYIGLYSTAVKIYTIIKNILSSLLIVLIPQFSILFANKNKEQVQEMFSKVFGFLNLAMLPLITGLIMIGEDVIMLISGRDFIEATTSLRLLSIATFFSLYAFMYVQCVLIPANQEKMVFFATCTSAIVNIVLNFILIPLFGFNAAAITTIAAELLTFLLTYKVGKRYVRIIGIGHDLVSFIVGCLGIVGICICSNLISIFLLRLFVEVVGSIVIYILILVIMKNQTFIDFLVLLRKKNHSL